MLNRLIRFFLDNRLVTVLLLAALVVGGLATAPFDWHGGVVPRDPIAVDAIPDLGDNQQIVATEWMGRSPKDIQEQITYPLTTALVGIPGVRTIRSTSMFGMSFIYIIFEDDAEFYWSRSRVLEKLNSLPPGTLPEGVSPALGPDATALGQIFWYTLEGRDPATGLPTGGWDPDELRSIQDFQVKYVLSTAAGVSEVASIGGYVREYQVELRPEAMRSLGVSIMDVMGAIQKNNIDIGAGTMEINRVEYLIRGLGYIKNVEDIENAVVTARGGVPVRVGDVAFVTTGPAPRRGGLDKEGVEAVGAVVVARYGANPLEVIEGVKAKIREMEAGMPQKTLADGTRSRVSVVPFYDRTGLIRETIGTLESALLHEILIVIIVILVLVMNLRAGLVISSLLPVAVLATFVMMKLTGMGANIVALSGIAIAIGVVGDVGIVVVESILRHRERPENAGKPLARLIYEASAEVAAPIAVAMATTVVSFIPVFALQGQEGKLFAPLAYTKTYVLGFAFVIGMVVLPTIAYFVFKWRMKPLPVGKAFGGANSSPWVRRLPVLLALAAAMVYLSRVWLPLGPERGGVLNLLFAILAVGGVLGVLWLLVIFYERILRWCLAHRLIFLTIPLATVAFGVWAWRGMGREFMPTLNEGSFLLMPTTMPHTGVEQNLEQIGLLDRRIAAIPEVERTVGKWGRVNSALDPAPIQMFENTIVYKPEYALDENGRRLRVDGKYVRQWRDEIRTTDDIWRQIVNAAHLPGMTSAPRLQPIEARLVMLSTGMRAPMGVKISGPDLDAIEAAGLEIERALKEVPSVNAASVFYDRAVGAPYIEIELLRGAMARHGIATADLQEVISAAVGGMPLTTTVEGRERYPVRLRYPRELRDSPEALAAILIPTPAGVQIPLGEVAAIRYARGAQMIRSENTFPVGYVIFDKLAGRAEVEVVEEARQALSARIDDGTLTLPAGTNYTFAGNYEQQARATRRLSIIIPIVLALVLVILYFQFRSVTASVIHFSGVFVAFAGGFILLWLYGQEWFLDFDFAGVNVRELFRMQPVNLSVAVWVGLIALFGVATDDGVLMGSYIHEVFRERNPQSESEIREAVVHAGLKRVRPAAMTTATTLIALLPVLTSTGKGAEIIVPMAIPTFGGMLIQSMTMFVVPVFQCMWRERKLKAESRKSRLCPPAGLNPRA